MPVAHLYRVIQDSAGNALPGVLVALNDPETEALIEEDVFADVDLTAQLTNPLTLLDGVLDIYLAAPRSVSVQATIGGISVTSDYNDVLPPAELLLASTTPIEILNDAFGSAILQMADPSTANWVDPTTLESGALLAVQPGTNVSVDNSDPQRPIINADGAVQDLVPGTNVWIDETDPTHPIISANGAQDYDVAAILADPNSRTSQQLALEFGAAPSQWYVQDDPYPSSAAVPTPYEGDQFLYLSAIADPPRRSGDLDSYTDGSWALAGNITGPQGNTGAQGNPGPQGTPGPQGVPGPPGLTGAQGPAGTGITVKGVLPNAASLPTVANVNGDAYVTADTGHLWTWNGTRWIDAGQFSGPKGDLGPAGPANSLAIGQVTTGLPGSTAAATIAGMPPSQTLSLAIPRGDPGTPGAPGLTGPPNTLSIGQVATGNPGDSAGATITGTAPNQNLNLSIPQGPQGTTGPTGPQGPSGDTGPANNLAIGSVGTGQPGDNAAADISGAPPNQQLNLSIPRGDKGDKGDPGDIGATGATGDTGATGQIGPPGPGRGVADASITGAGQLHFVYTDTSTEDVGKVLGDTGPQGPQGATGPAGPQGSPGADSTVPGPTGSQGPKGDTGPQGSQGPQGPTGTTGTPGAKGDTGAQGAQGDPGPQGNPGSTGSQGPKGDTGAGVPTGGATGQALVKAANTDYTFAWATPFGAITSASDFNACTATGLYRVSASDANGLPAHTQAVFGNYSGILAVYATTSGGSYLTQLWQSTTQSMEVWGRSYASGVWSAWIPVSEAKFIGVDCNACILPGTYNLTVAATNRPSGASSSGILIVFSDSPDGAVTYGTGQTVQFYSDFSYAQTWTRSSTNSGTSWSAWLQIAVKDANGRIQVTVAPAAGTDLANKTYVDTKLNWRGQWSNAATYAPNDVVYDVNIGGAQVTNTWVCIAAVSSSTGPMLDSGHWAELGARHNINGNLVQLPPNAAPSAPTEVTPKSYVDNQDAGVRSYVDNSAGVSGASTANTLVRRDANGRAQAAAPSAAADLTPKAYVDAVQAPRTVGATITSAITATVGTLNVINLAANQGNVAITLPVAAAQGSVVAFIRVDNNTFTSAAMITAASGSGDVIADTSPFNLSMRNTVTTFTYVGTTWYAAQTVSGTAYLGGATASWQWAPTVMSRDSTGRSQVVDPSAAQDIATKNYVDTNAMPSAIPAITSNGTISADSVIKTGLYTGTSSGIGIPKAALSGNSTVTGLLQVFAAGVRVWQSWMGCYSGSAGQYGYDDLWTRTSADTGANWTAWTPQRAMMSNNLYDFNLCVAAGVYVMPIGTSNAPPNMSGTLGVLVVESPVGSQSATHNMIQNFYSYGGDRSIWNRTCTSGGVWSNWVRLAPSGFGGLATISLSAAATGSIAITYPASPTFGFAPAVVATCEDINYFCAVTARSTTGCTITIHHYKDTTATASKQIDYQVIPV